MHFLHLYLFCSHHQTHTTTTRLSLSKWICSTAAIIWISSSACEPRTHLPTQHRVCLLLPSPYTGERNSTHVLNKSASPASPQSTTTTKTLQTHSLRRFWSTCRSQRTRTCDAHIHAQITELQRWTPVLNSLCRCSALTARLSLNMKEDPPLTHSLILQPRRLLFLLSPHIHITNPHIHIGGVRLFMVSHTAPITFNTWTLSQCSAVYVSAAQISQQ